MNYDNPAARLLTILKLGKSQPASASCKSVWEALLDAHAKPSVLMSRLGKVMELPEQVIAAINENFPQQGGIWAHWSGQVNAAFQNQNLQSDWNSFIGHIDDHTISYLNLTSELLASKSTTKLIPDVSLVDIRKNLQDVLDEIFASEQPDEIKKFLARKIRGILTSIDEYRLTGALPLLDSIDTTIGHAAINKEYKHFLFDTDLGNRLRDNLSAMVDVVTVAVGIPQLSLVIAQLAR